jgi:Mg2+-importing ATPase
VLSSSRRDGRAIGSPSEWSFWSASTSDALTRLKAGPQGLGQQEARQRLFAQASRLLRPRKRAGAVALCAAQFRSPLILILCFAAALSFFLRDRADALIIMVIVLATATLGFWQERGAAAAVDGLLAMVQVTANALRDGVATDVPAHEVVPGVDTAIHCGSHNLHVAVAVEITQGRGAAHPEARALRPPRYGRAVVIPRVGVDHL